MELITREINSSVIKEKDLKQNIHFLEKEIGDAKDSLRSAYQELETRTKENDHLVSLLEE